MAYNNKFVLTVFHNGNIVKELENGQINLPFGSEYKVRLKNKHNRRAICKLFIDGENVSGGGFIIDAHSHIDVERSVDVAKKFKFVSLDSDEAHEFGKNGPNHSKIKGTIRAEFALEKQYTCDPVIPVMNPDPWKHWGYPQKRVTWEYPKVTSSVGDGLIKYGNMLNKLTYESKLSDSKDLSFGDDSSALKNSVFYSSICDSSAFETKTSGQVPLKDGATVEGSYSTQSFQHVYFNHDNNWYTVKVFLQGYDPKQKTKPEVNLVKEIKQDDELVALEKELLELKKQKMRKEIELLKAELA